MVEKERARLSRKAAKKRVGIYLASLGCGALAEYGLSKIMIGYYFGDFVGHAVDQVFNPHSIGSLSRYTIELCQNACQLVVPLLTVLIGGTMFYRLASSYSGRSPIMHDLNIEEGI